jgi:hypothetical protein
MPPYIAVENHAIFVVAEETHPFLDTLLSENRGREKKEDRRSHSSASLGTGGAVVEAAGTALDGLLLRDGDDVGGNAVELS